MWLTMARPRPVPRPLVEKYGRNSFSLSPAEMPQPVSATSSSTVSAAVERVATSRRLTSESRMASAALSTRLTTTRLNCSRVDVHRGKVGREIDAQVDGVQPAGEHVQRVANHLVQIARRRVAPRGSARTAKTRPPASSPIPLRGRWCRRTRAGCAANPAEDPPRSSSRAIRSAESAIGVSGFFSSCAMRRATSCHAAAFCARSSSLVSSSTSTNPVRGGSGARAARKPSPPDGDLPRRLQIESGWRPGRCAARASSGTRISLTSSGGNRSWRCAWRLDLLSREQSVQRAIDAADAAVGSQRNHAGGNAFQNRLGESAAAFELAAVGLQRMHHFIEAAHQGRELIDCLHGTDETGCPCGPPPRRPAAP